MNQEKVNFYEVQQEAEKYFSTRAKGKGSGYKQYKRWEYLKRKEINDNGFLISDKQVWEEHYRWNNSHQTQNRQSLSGDWKTLGPNSWTRTSGWNPGVGRVVCIAVEPVNEQLIYVGSPTGGLWKTTDGGTSWTVLTDDMPVMDVWSVTIDPLDTSKVYMGTSGGGVLKSTDGGQNWTTLSGTTGTIRRILVNPNNTNQVFASSSGGIWRSTNGGSNWSKVHFTSIEDMEFKPGDPNTIYATGTRFYRSTNNGVSFTQISTGITHVSRLKLAVTPADNNYVYLIQNSGSIFGRVYRSTNGGTSFTTQISYQGANTNTNFLGYSSTGNDTNGQAWRDMAISVSRTNKDEVYIAGIHVWKSTDGAQSFRIKTYWALPTATNIGLSYNHADVEVLQVHGSTLYSGSDGGIFKSLDTGHTFIDLTPGLEIRQFYRIGSSQLDSNVVSGGSQDNGTSVMRGTGRSWVDWLGADGMETFVDHSNANTLYGTSQYGSMYKSTNQGNSRFGISKPSGVTNGAWVTPFEQDPQVASTIYVGFDELYRNTTGGSGGAGSWTAISNVNFGTMDEIGIAPSDNQTIYISDGGVIHRTTNGGLTWTNVSSGVTGVINYISVDPNDPMRVALAVSGSAKVLLSTNGGSTWTNEGSGLPSIGANCVLLDQTADNGIYVGMQSGVYFKNNSQPTWISFMSGLPLVRVYELEIQLQSQKIRAATYGRGLWESPVYNAGNIAPVANLTAVSTDVIVGDTVFFLDASAGTPNNWSWNFPGGTPSSSSDQNPYTIYNAAGSYDVSLTASNTFGADSITRSGFINVRPYCLSSATNSIDSYIRTVQFRGINQTDPSCAIYTDNSNLTAQVKRGSSYSITVVTDDCDGGGTYNKGFKVYIDWNSDNNYDEATEMVFSVPLQASGTFNGTINVPAGASIGRTGMRVVCSESSVINPCGTYTYGETEDYSVNITDTVISCPTVSIDSLFQYYSTCDYDSMIPLRGGNPAGGFFGGASVSNGMFNINAAGPGTHSFYYNYDDGASCQGVDSGSVTILASPQFQFSETGTTGFSGDTLFSCVTDPLNPSLSLYYVLQNGGSLNPPVLGTWSSLSGGFVIFGNNSPSGSSSLATYFPIPDSSFSRVRLSVTDLNGCRTIDTLTVSIDRYAMVAMDLSDSIICYGDTIQATLNNLPAQNFSHIITRTGPISGVSSIYPLGPSNTITIVPGKSLTNPLPNPSSPTWYHYQWAFTDASGCQSIEYDSVLVYPAPNVSLPVYQDMCINQAPVLLGGGLPLFGTYSGTGINNGYFDPSVAGLGRHTINYSYSNIAGCSDSDTSSIYVHSIPNVTHLDPGPICENSGILNLSGGSPAGGTYSGTAVFGSGFNPNISGVGTHPVVYTYSDMNNCTSSDTFHVVVQSSPVVSHPSIPDFCSGDPAFNLSGGSPSGGAYSGNGVNGSQFDPSLSGSGIHAISYTVVNGVCSSTTQFNAVVHQAPTSDFSYNANGLTVNYFDQSSGASTWRWYFGDGAQAIGINPLHTYSSPGTYTVCLAVQSFEGCEDSICQDVTLELLGVASNNSDLPIRVFPNPVDERLTILLDFEHQDLRGELVDALGREVRVFEIESDSKRYELDMGELPAGSYFLILNHAEEGFRIHLEKR